MFKHGFPPEWSTFKKLIWLVGTGIAGAASGIWKTATGALIHITDALASPMRKCEVSLEPIQDLHGQDAPYPAGGGKNKFDESTVTFGEWISSNGAINYNTAYGCVSSKIPAKSTAYNLKSFGNTPNTWSIMEYASDDSFITRTHGSGSNPIGVTLNQSTEYIRVQVSCSTEDTMTAEKLASYKVVLAEGATSPTAYSPFANICPITGWTGCEVWVKDEYDPSLPATASVTFPDTVYGGKYDFVGGSGNSRFAEYIFTGNESWFASSTPNRFGLNLTNLSLDVATQPMVTNAKQNVYSSIFGQFIYKNADNVAYTYIASNAINIAINTPLASTVQEIAQLFAGTQLVYELAEPIGIQLAAQEITTLEGENNVWSDGKIKLTYKANA